MREKYTLYQEEKNKNYFQMLEMLTLLGSARNFLNNIPNRFLITPKTTVTRITYLFCDGNLSVLAQDQIYLFLMSTQSPQTFCLCHW